MREAAVSEGKDSPAALAAATRKNHVDPGVRPEMVKDVVLEGVVMGLPKPKPSWER